MEGQGEKAYRTELTPVSFLRRSAYVFPEKVAVVHGERRYTYRELEERVNRLASRLRDSGLQKGDKVAFSPRTSRRSWRRTTRCRPRAACWCP
jgi:fatty-acyl-CoA synthase